MRRLGILLFVLAGTLFLFGCATVHRYPAYRGKVLELGTDKPIEGAGVLAAYWMTVSMPPERNSRYVGYQAVLTDKDGKFEIPSKVFSAFQPLASFDPKVEITIYKRGYGNFPASFPLHRGFPGVSRAGLGKEGKTDPPLERDQLPFEAKVTFWFPKLETAEEIREHDRYFSFTAGEILREKSFPPPGTKKGQFLPSKY